ncbi:hypothetical protein [Alteromonas gilva]|uniref:Uncharacterized protein n=1 Tax=Alteromonas gilva TaxID=2987522 RepID=A0ABT5L2F3_9ALTE|nr:hypothetical protein [Alteromonas gilva]MDC8830604.1 hypothetical protein [Alteromonas gilva]
MNNDIKGLCLFLGGIGLLYTMFLVLVAVFTGVKIIKSIVFIATFSAGLVSLGLTPQVRQRLTSYVKSQFIR